MAEKGVTDSPAISPSISVQTSDSDQDPSAFNSNSVQDPPDSDTHFEVLDFFRQEEKAEEEKVEEEEEEEEDDDDDEETLREGKRRKKNCPASLEKSLSSNRGFSFSFDTKISPIDSTPKFGSFNLGFGGSSDFDGIPLGLELGLGFQEHHKSSAAEGEKKQGLKPEEEGGGEG